MSEDQLNDQPKKLTEMLHGKTLTPPIPTREELHNHVEKLAKILRERGCEELSRLIDQHIRSDPPTIPGTPLKKAPRQCSSSPGSPEYTVKMIIGWNFHQVYGYDLTILRNARSPDQTLQLKCSVHGSFTVTVNDHIKEGKGCPLCRTRSGHERKFMEFMIKNDRKFDREVHFPKIGTIVKDGREVVISGRFDFKYWINGTIPVLCEIDGFQHFGETNFPTGLSLKERQERDIIKTKYAMQNGYRVVRIDGKEINNIAFHYKKSTELFLSTPDEKLYLAGHHDESYNYILEGLSQESPRKKTEETCKKSNVHAGRVSARVWCQDAIAPFLHCILGKE